MAVDRLEVRVSITKLLLSLIIVIVPLSVIGLILTERSDKVSRPRHRRRFQEHGPDVQQRRGAIYSRPCS